MKVNCSLKTFFVHDIDSKLSLELYFECTIFEDYKFDFAWCNLQTKNCLNEYLSDFIKTFVKTFSNRYDWPTRNEIETMNDLLELPTVPTEDQKKIQIR